MRSGKVTVLFNSAPMEFKAESVIVDVKGIRQEIRNEFVWIFAGGTPPNDFLKSRLWRSRRNAGGKQSSQAG